MFVLKLHLVHLLSIHLSVRKLFIFNNSKTTRPMKLKLGIDNHRSEFLQHSDLIFIMATIMPTLECYFCFFLSHFCMHHYELMICSTICITKHANNNILFWSSTVNNISMNSSMFLQWGCLSWLLWRNLLSLMLNAIQWKWSTLSVLTTQPTSGYCRWRLLWVCIAVREPDAAPGKVQHTGTHHSNACSKWACPGLHHMLDPSFDFSTIVLSTISVAVVLIMYHKIAMWKSFLGKPSSFPHHGQWLNLFLHAFAYRHSKFKV